MHKKLTIHRLKPLMALIFIITVLAMLFLQPVNTVMADGISIYGIIKHGFDDSLVDAQEYEAWGPATSGGMKITQRSHLGGALDIRVVFGDGQPSPLLAMRSGKVIYSGDPGYGFGNTVCVQSYWQEVYCLSHNSKNTVSDGQLVNKGDGIAIGGNTGTGTGYHCHIQIWRQDETGEWRQTNVSNTLFGKQVSLGWVAMLDSDDVWASEYDNVLERK